MFVVGFIYYFRGDVFGKVYFLILRVLVVLGVERGLGWVNGVMGRIGGRESGRRR